MFSLLFAFFLAVSAENSVCQSRFDPEENLYKSVALNSDDITLRRNYLKKYGECITEEGIRVIEEKDVAIVEELDCRDPLEGIEFFFRNKKLCSRSVRFFPSKKVFAIKKKGKVSSLPENWRYIETPETLLFYDSAAKFAENSDIEGNILEKNESGLYLDSSGKAVYPEFIYSNGTWEKVLPLREFFGFSAEGKNFAITIISEKHSGFSQKELFDLLGLKAESAELPAKNQAVLKIKGSGLKGVKIPKFEYAEDSTCDYGRYEIVLKEENLKQMKEIKLGGAEYELEISVSDGVFKAVLSVFTKKLSSSEAAKIQSVINREIPSFFVEKK